MPRPCESEHPPQYRRGEEYDRDAKPCRRCYLYVNSEVYRRVWDDPGAALGGKPLTALSALDDGEPCRHFGEPTGETVRCPSCRGHVEVKLFRCGVYGECTTHKVVGGTACCRTVGGCPGRQASPREGQGAQMEAKAKAQRRARRPAVTWAVGLTTVPSRRDNLLPATLESLKAAGFDNPRLFVDGCTNREAIWWEEQFGLEVTARNPRIRTFMNWVLGIAELYGRQPQADRYAMFQDDLIAVGGLREYLESCAYPDGQDRRPTGYWNLLTFPENQALAPKNERGGTLEGWFKSNQKGRGAVALVFNREAVLRLLTSYQHIIDRPLTSGKRGWSAIDGGIVDALRKQGWSEFCHSPSLVRHTGQHGHPSTMGHQPFPVDESFPGESFNALTLAGEPPSGAGEV